MILLRDIATQCSPDVERVLLLQKVVSTVYDMATLIFDVSRDRRLRLQDTLRHKLRRRRGGDGNDDGDGDRTKRRYRQLRRIKFRRREQFHSCVNRLIHSLYKYIDAYRRTLWQQRERIFAHSEDREHFRANDARDGNMGLKVRCTVIATTYTRDLVLQTAKRIASEAVAKGGMSYGLTISDNDDDDDDEATAVENVGCVVEMKHSGTAVAADDVDTKRMDITASILVGSSSKYCWLPGTWKSEMMFLMYVCKKALKRTVASMHRRMLEPVITTATVATAAESTTTTTVDESTVDSSGNNNGGGKLVCHVCGRVFTKTFHYLQHIRVHYRLNLYLCVHCNEAFV